MLHIGISFEFACLFATRLPSSTNPTVTSSKTCKALRGWCLAAGHAEFPPWNWHLILEVTLVARQRWQSKVQYPEHMQTTKHRIYRQMNMVKVYVHNTYCIDRYHTHTYIYIYVSTNICINFKTLRHRLVPPEWELSPPCGDNYINPFCSLIANHVINPWRWRKYHQPKAFPLESLNLRSGSQESCGSHGRHHWAGREFHFRWKAVEAMNRCRHSWHTIHSHHCFRLANKSSPSFLFIITWLSATPIGRERNFVQLFSWKERGVIWDNC